MQNKELNEERNHRRSLEQIRDYIISLSKNMFVYMSDMIRTLGSREQEIQELIDEHKNLAEKDILPTAIKVKQHQANIQEDKKALAQLRGFVGATKDTIELEVDAITSGKKFGPGGQEYYKKYLNMDPKEREAEKRRLNKGQNGDLASTSPVLVSSDKENKNQQNLGKDLLIELPSESLNENQQALLETEPRAPKEALSKNPNDNPQDKRDKISASNYDATQEQDRYLGGAPNQQMQMQAQLVINEHQLTNAERLEIISTIDALRDVLQLEEMTNMMGVTLAAQEERVDKLYNDLMDQLSEAQKQQVIMHDIKYASKGLGDKIVTAIDRNKGFGYGIASMGVGLITGLFTRNNWIAGSGFMYGTYKITEQNLKNRNTDETRRTNAAAAIKNLREQFKQFAPEGKSILKLPPELNPEAQQHIEGRNSSHQQIQIDKTPKKTREQEEHELAELLAEIDSWGDFEISPGELEKINKEIESELQQDKEQLTEDKFNTLFDNLYLGSTREEYMHYSPGAVNELQTHLENSGFSVVDNAGQGNCFYHALSQQVNINYDDIRSRAIHEILTHPDRYSDFLGEQSLDEFIENNIYDGSEADNLIIRATANALDMNINIVSPDGQLLSFNQGRENQHAVTVMYTGNHYLAVINNNNEYHSDGKNIVKDNQEFKIDKVMNSYKELQEDKHKLFGKDVIIKRDKSSKEEKNKSQLHPNHLLDAEDLKHQKSLKQELDHSIDRSSKDLDSNEGTSFNMQVKN